MKILLATEHKINIENAINRIDNLTEYNFNMLVKRIMDSNSNMDTSYTKSILQNIQDPCICIGTGGSRGASLFASKVLALKNKIISTNCEPRDILYQELNCYRNLLAITYGNNNHGIDIALKCAREAGLKTFILTANDELNGQDEILPYKGILEKEYSFISLASTLTPMSIMLKYYLDIDDLQLNCLLEQLYSNAGDEITTKSIKYLKTIEVMSGDNTYVAAEILQSTIIEAGLGIPVIHEKYSYCHGKSTLSYHQTGNVIVYLINGDETELDKKLLLEISSSYEEVIILRSNCNDKIISEFDLALKSLFLCKKIASNMDKDLSKVDYSPVVKKLYKYKGEM